MSKTEDLTGDEALDAMERGECTRGVIGSVLRVHDGVVECWDYGLWDVSKHNSAELLDMVAPLRVVPDPSVEGDSP